MGTCLRILKRPPSKSKGSLRRAHPDCDTHKIRRKIIKKVLFVLIVINKSGAVVLMKACPQYVSSQFDS